MQIAAFVCVTYLGDDGPTNAQARGLASALLKTPEEVVDRWAAR